MADHIAAILVCEATIFHPSLNFWRFMVLFPTTVCLELGKVTDHQVRANAKSGFNSLTWMRLGWMKPMVLRSGYPLMYESCSCCQPLNCSESTTTNSSGDFQYTSKCPSM